jgi:hypothetical protein
MEIGTVAEAVVAQASLKELDKLVVVVDLESQ